MIDNNVRGTESRLSLWAHSDGGGAVQRSTPSQWRTTAPPLHSTRRRLLSTGLRGMHNSNAIHWLVILACCSQGTSVDTIHP